MRPVSAVLLVAVVGGVVTFALGGELLTTRDPLRTVAAPWADPAPGIPLGADGLGRDVFARVLAGGRDLSLISLLAAATASGLGVAGGLWAGWHQGRSARVLLAGADLLLALPLLLLVLVAVVALPGPVAIVLGTVLGGAPLTLRVVADATAGTRHAGYLEAALARGESGPSVLLREVLPVHAGLLGADLGVRVVLAVQLTAALGVLGFGPSPPAADWGVMLRENLAGVVLNPAAMLAPAVALAVLAGTLAAAAHLLTADGGAS